MSAIVTPTLVNRDDLNRALIKAHCTQVREVLEGYLKHFKVTYKKSLRAAEMGSLLADVIRMATDETIAAMAAGERKYGRNFPAPIWSTDDQPARCGIGWITDATVLPPTTAQEITSRMTYAALRSQAADVISRRQRVRTPEKRHQVFREYIESHDAWLELQTDPGNPAPRYWLFYHVSQLGRPFPVELSDKLVERSELWVGRALMPGQGATCQLWDETARLIASLLAGEAFPAAPEASTGRQTILACEG